MVVVMCEDWPREEGRGSVLIETSAGVAFAGFGLGATANNGPRGFHVATISCSDPS
jgi:hypothetical protein